MLISIEGNIGTGKTTLINMLNKKFGKKNNVIFVDEPLQQWLNLKDSDGENNGGHIHFKCMLSLLVLRQFLNKIQMIM